MEMNEQFTITFKFGGYWTIVKNQGRRRYEGGKQKTCKFRKSSLNFEVMKVEIQRICEWITGHDFEFYYHIGGTSPKEYALIASDIEVINMMAQYQDSDRVEVVVITQDIRDTTMCLQAEVINDDRTTQDCNILVSDYIYDENNENIRSNELVVGAQFQDSFAFKHALRTFAITNNFGVKIQATNKERVVAVCSYRGCPWRVRAALCKDGRSFEVRRLVATHMCPGINRAGNKLASSAWVSEEIKDIIRKDPYIPPKQINNTLEDKFGLSLPYMKLWRSREVARDIIFGSIDDNYRLVPAFCEELLKWNPGSHICYSCSKHDNAFKRFFVSFKVSIDGFLAGCRPFIGLDACHLKSKYLGVLLSANSLDGNHGLFTLAFAVAESESKNSWTWFLENLAISIGFDLQYLAFISDMEKGLAEAVKNVFPLAEHRVCLRHLWKNLKKHFSSHDSQNIGSLFWSAAGSLTELDYVSKMNELYVISPQIHSYLTHLPYKWAKWTFLVEIKIHYNTNNLSESFNSWIAEARNKPAVELLDTIRAKLMEQRAERKSNSLNLRGDLVPYAEEYIREITTRKEQFIIRQATPNKAEIEAEQGRFKVDILSKECSCRGWQLSGLPCIHAAAFISTKDLPLWHCYIHESYHVIRYRMAYEGHIETLPGKEQWIVPEDVIPVGVPQTMRPRGRPKKKRNKNFMEQTNYKSKNLHKCSRCGLWGHHKTGCKNPLGQTSVQGIDADMNDYVSEQVFCSSGSRPKLPVKRVTLE